MNRRNYRSLVGASAWLLCIQVILVAEQRQSERRVAGPGETQFNVQLLRPSGGPVIPIFEGWYQHPDGSYELSFGYFNTNTEELIDIPIGADNFIEPAQYDGVQPTHFLAVPEGDRRHWGTFTVSVPADFGDQDVVWTLRMDNGRQFSVPGRVTRPPYELHGAIFPGDSTASPLLWLEPDGSKGVGPWGVSTGPLTGRVGQALSLTVWTTRVDQYRSDARPINVRWFKHQGPGSATFSHPTTVVETSRWMAAEGGSVDTEVIFGSPGHYVLRALAYNTIREFEFQCCWTNGYFHITVIE